MKKALFILSLVFLFSCSKPAENQSSNSNVKQLKSLKDTSTSFGAKYLNLYYENNVLLKINSGEKDNYLDYGQMKYSNGKISQMAYDKPSGINSPENFDYNFDFGSSDVSLTTISYVGNSIYSVYNNQNETFNLNNEKQIISIVRKKNLSDEFIYNGNQIIKQKHYGYYEAEYTFAFDDKINPLNILYTKFGLLENSICPLLSSITIYYFLMPNNITKVYKNGVLLYSFIYQYNTENYPTSVVAYDYNTKETYQYVYVYNN